VSAAGWSGRIAGQRNEENVMATTKTLPGMAVVVGIVLASTAVAAQDMRIEALERTFWRCDHAATQGLLDAGAAMDCSVATEALKVRKFGGDFGAMLAWWRERKDAEHLALARASAQRLAVRRP
jgi:hypothetical protein